MDMEAMKQKIAKLALIFPPEKRSILMKTIQDIMPRLGKDEKVLNNPECITYTNNDFEYRDTDIILASFPKTGTNWTGNILQRAIFANEPELSELHSNLPIIFALEAGDPIKFQLMDCIPGKRRFFVTHQNGDILNRKKIKDSKVKVIYVLRNPKDQIVSQFNFFRRQTQFTEHPEKKDWFKNFDSFFPHALGGDFHMDGYYPPDKSTYVNHILSWLPNKEDDHIKFLYFEDLKKDFMGELENVTKFLDLSLTDEQKDEIAEKTSIGNMRKEYAAKNLPEGLIHKGGVGGWRDVLSDDQSKQIDAVFQPLHGTEVEFQYTLNDS